MRPNRPLRREYNPNASKESLVLALASVRSSGLPSEKWPETSKHAVDATIVSPEATIGAVALTFH